MSNPVQFTPLKAPRIFGDRDLRSYMLDIKLNRKLSL